MKLLSFDTSGRALSIALYNGEKKIGGYVSPENGRRASALVSEIDKLLRKHRTPVSKIGALAVCVGPGSFTGLRIGVTAAKMLSHLLKIKAVAVSSLEAVAAGSSADAALVLLEAGRGQVYAAAFRRKKGTMAPAGRPAVMTRERALLRYGTGLAVIENIRPDADKVARAAMCSLRDKKFTAAARLEPLYVYPRDCNVKRPKK